MECSANSARHFKQILDAIQSSIQRDLQAFLLDYEQLDHTGVLPKEGPMREAVAAMGGVKNTQNLMMVRSMIDWEARRVLLNQQSSIEDATTDCQVAELAERFRSGNSVPVDSVQLKASEFEKLFGYDPRDEIKRAYCLSRDDMLRLASKRFAMSQEDAYRAATDLYSSGYLSYPQTEERRLSPDVYDAAPEILEKLVGYGFEAAAGAHDHVKTAGVGRPAVYSGEPVIHGGLYPTAKVPSRPLEGHKAKVYELVVEQYIRAHSPAAQA